MTEPVSLIPLKLPRPVLSFHQLELTSRCDLRCVYCTNPKLARLKTDMSWEHFQQSLDHVRYHVKNGTQTELNLAGIGESFLHPLFADMCRDAREVLGDKIMIHVTTNGIIASDREDLIAHLAKHQIGMFVSLHRPEKAGKAIELAKKHGIFLSASSDPSLAATTWAGQVDWFHSADRNRPCPWIRSGRVMVRADGAVTTCCLDSGNNPDAVIGTVDDPVGSFYTKPYSLCASCDQQIAVQGYEQYPKPEKPLHVL